jgi:phytoene desaturase
VEKRAAIIGGGLGGLSAAIHLRHAGFDVTIFEANERVGGRANLIERDGFSFDTGPSLLNYPWVFEKLFALTGRRLQDYVTLLPVEPSVTFQWPDGTRFTLSSDVQRLIEECERLEPKSGPGLIAFLRDTRSKFEIAFDKLVTKNADSYVTWLSGVSPMDLLRLRLWRSFYKELGRFFKSRYIREALGSYGMYLGGSPFDLPGLFSILPYGELTYGLWLPKGGVYGLVRGIDRLARELGVTIRTGCTVKEILTNGASVKGVMLEDGSITEFPVVVSNVDVPTTDSVLLHRSGRGNHRLNGVSRLKMTPSVMTFYWGVRGNVDLLPHHTIFLPGEYRSTFDELMKRGVIPQEIPFYVSLPSSTDPGLAPPGDTTMFVLVPLPLLSQLGEVDWHSTVRSIRQRVLDRLRWHGVVLSEDRIAVEEVMTPVDWERRFGLFDGSAFGASHTLFQMGPGRYRNYSRTIKGMYYTGASTTPGTGMPMVVLSGKMTAERILHALR